MLFYTLCTLIAVLSLAKLLTHIHHTLRKRRLGYISPPSYPHLDPILGLDFFIKKMLALKSGTYLSTSATPYLSIKSKTFKITSFCNTIYHTIDPDVVKGYQSIHFKDFGYGPIRYHLAENLWGNGIAVADGESWTAARRFIRGSFDVVHTANIQRLEHHVDKFMALLPCDGATVDLLPLFKRLVSGCYPLRFVPSRSAC
jgi:cytochrome P450